MTQYVVQLMRLQEQVTHQQRLCHLLTEIAIFFHVSTTKKKNVVFFGPKFWTVSVLNRNVCMYVYGQFSPVILAPRRLQTFTIVLLTFHQTTERMTPRICCLHIYIYIYIYCFEPIFLSRISYKFTKILTNLEYSTLNIFKYFTKLGDPKLEGPISTHLTIKSYCHAQFDTIMVHDMYISYATLTFIVLRNNIVMRCNPIIWEIFKKIKKKFVVMKF